MHYIIKGFEYNRYYNYYINYRHTYWRKNEVFLKIKKIFVKIRDIDLYFGNSQ